MRRPVPQVAKDRRQALRTSLNEHQKRQIQSRADLTGLGIAPKRAPWRRIGARLRKRWRKSREPPGRYAAALESRRRAREPKPTDDTDA